MRERGMIMKTASEAATEAAALISSRGLAKGALENWKGEICHNGAVSLAVTGSALALGRSEEGELIREILGRSKLVLERMESPFTPSMYNDQESTSAEDIILLLKQNAALDEDPSAVKEIARRRSAGEFTSFCPPGEIFSSMPLTS
jgi:hypothetical protein